MKNDSQNPADAPTKGGRNIVILGILSAVITAVLSCISLGLYHYSGDVYLDRSRPGFLPSEEEIEQDAIIEKPDYNFSDSGSISGETIDEYLEKIQKEIDYLEKFENPFSDKALKDDKLGIPTEEIQE